MNPWNSRFLTRIVVLPILAISSPSAWALEASEKEAEPVAIVYRLNGEVTLLRDQTASPEILELFEHVRPGARLSTGPEAELELIFLDGERYLLESSSAAVVGTRGLAAESGSLRQLARVPPIRVLVPLAGLDTHQRALAIRLRRRPDAPLRPSDGENILATPAVLSFEPVDDVARYRLRVEDETGTVVYSVETSNTTVELPPATLQPGRLYYWNVDSGAAGGSATRRSALFRTLSEEAARARSALVEDVEARGEPALTLLMAEIDQGLGLYREARRHPRPTERAECPEPGR